MRDYILRGGGAGPDRRDVAPAFVQRAMTWAKATNEITGLIRGVLADGVVSEGEAKYLRQWISSRPELLVDPLVKQLSCRIERIFADGVVTPEELEELRGILTDFVPREESAPTTLPLDKPPPAIIIPQHAFCFTGVFVSGKRSWCQQQVITRNGIAHDSFQTGTDFLVIGSKVSSAWANQSYGRKIEAAAAAKQEGAPVAIVTEEHWLKFL